MPPTSPTSERLVTITVRVRYAETDQMGFAHHANFFVWFEMARVAYCDAIGTPYRDIEAGGFLLPVVDAHCRFRSPARFDDELTLDTFLVEKTRRTLKIGYRVWRGETLLAEGDTAHVVMGTDGKATRFPPKFWNAFNVSAFQCDFNETDFYFRFTSFYSNP